MHVVSLVWYQVVVVVLADSSMAAVTVLMIYSIGKYFNMYLHIIISDIYTGVI